MEMKVDADKCPMLKELCTLARNKILNNATSHTTKYWNVDDQ